MRIGGGLLLLTFFAFDLRRWGGGGSGDPGSMVGEKMRRTEVGVDWRVLALEDVRETGGVGVGERGGGGDGLRGRSWNE